VMMVGTTIMTVVPTYAVIGIAAPMAVLGGKPQSSAGALA